MRNDPTPIAERKSLSSQNHPHVVIEREGTTNQIVFQNNAWNSTYPDIRIFDDNFVHENIYSGLEVTSDHRQNLHQLIIGNQGVLLAQRVEEVTEEISRIQSELRSRASSFSVDMLGPNSIDEFCVLTPIQNIDEAILQAEQRLTALQQAETVRITPHFEPFEPPTINTSDIQTLLRTTLSDIDTQSLQAIQAHLRHIGVTGETWVSQGMELLNATSQAQTCPFCNQSLSGSDLMNHYRAYFSRRYAAHKASIDNQINEVNRILGEDSFMRFNHLITQQTERHRFWSQFISLDAFSVDLEQTTNAWRVLRSNLIGLLRAKQNAPLEEIVFDEESNRTVQTYESLRDNIRTFSRLLIQANESIRRLKEEALTGSLVAATNDLKRLRSTKTRFSDTVILLCTAYLDAKSRKETAEAQKLQAREALDQYRASVFPRYQTAINEYLRKFNAGFRIAEVQAINPRGIISSMYQIEINSCRVPLTQQNPEEPAFKNTLSAGDRNTLALAFFFSALDQEQSLSSIVVIVDDPVSSLDEGRTITTAQEIRGLVQRAKQVILLSHSRQALCEVWRFADHQNCSALSVVGNASGSTIEKWNVQGASITEYDRQHALLRNYISGTERDIRRVAEALRHVLEGYFRVVCTQHFPPGAMLGDLVNRAKESTRAGSPFMSDANIAELEAILQYANRFHHNTNASWDIVVNNINEQELRGFVNRVLAFTKK